MSATIHLGDCLDPVSGLSSLADKSIDHVITDPPYEAEAHTDGRRVKRGSGASCRVSDEPLDFAAMTTTVRAGSARQMARLSLGWLLVFCQAEAVGLWRAAMGDAGAAWRRSMVWVKPDGQPQLSGDRPGVGYESIAAAWAGRGRSRWNGGGRHGVYRINKSQGGKKHLHPTQKPPALMEALIRDFTQPGDLILDPFAGSGSTGVAAIRLGRRFVGWEQDPRYYAIAAQRLSGVAVQLDLLAPRPPAPPRQGRLL